MSFNENYAPESSTPSLLKNMGVPVLYDEGIEGDVSSQRSLKRQVRQIKDDL